MDSGSAKSIEKEEQSGVINDTTDLVCSSLDSSIPILLTAMGVSLLRCRKQLGTSQYVFASLFTAPDVMTTTAF